MVNVCALRCIGKEKNREKQFHKSEFRRERQREERRGGGEMKDNR